MYNEDEKGAFIRKLARYKADDFDIILEQEPLSNCQMELGCGHIMKTRQQEIKITLELITTKEEIIKILGGM